jgi:UDP-glucose 6-dehydrogenase
MIDTGYQGLEPVHILLRQELMSSVLMKYNKKIDILNDGCIPINELGPEDITKSNVQENSMFFTTDFVDIILVYVERK